MLKTRWLNFGFVVPMLAGLLLVIAVSCGDSATSTTAPQAAATAVAPTLVPTPVPTADTGTAMVKPTGTLNVGFKELGAFESHPALTTGPGMLQVGVTIAETLVYLDDKLEFTPRLATAWSLSPDGLVYTFNIREGIPFHKGYGEMTAEDVIWSIQTNTAKGSRSPWTGQYKRLWLNDKGSVTTPDDHTIVLHTGELQYDGVLTLSAPSGGYVVSKKQAEELGADEASRNGAGTGPWEIVDQKTGEFWKFKAVEGHWRKTPEFAEMVWFEMPEESTRVANFQAGKLDTFAMAFDSKPAIESVPGTKFMRIEGAIHEGLGIYGNYFVGWGTPEHSERAPGYDPSKPWISSTPDVNSDDWKRAVKVRQAMMIAIDRQLIVDTLLGGEGEPGVLWGWNGLEHRLDPDLRSWEFNPEKARQLLADAGYADGFDLTLTPDTQGLPSEIEVCEAIGTMWEDIGINVKVNKVPYLTIRPEYVARIYNGASCHGGGDLPDPGWVYGWAHNADAGWTLGMDHPFIQERLEKSVSQSSEEDRYITYNEMARFIYENALSGEIYKVNAIWPLGPKVDDWSADFNYGDRRALSSTEYASHRK